MAVSRRQFLVALLAPAVISPLAQNRNARAAIETDNLDEFERILKARLRARRPEEMAFIATVSRCLLVRRALAANVQTRRQDNVRTSSF